MSFFICYILIYTYVASVIKFVIRSSAAACTFQLQPQPTAIARSQPLAASTSTTNVEQIIFYFSAGASGQRLAGGYGCRLLLLAAALALLLLRTPKQATPSDQFTTGKSIHYSVKIQDSSIQVTGRQLQVNCFFGLLAVVGWLLHLIEMIYFNFNRR